MITEGTKSAKGKGHEGKGHEGQATSDDQLRDALGLLQQAQPQLSDPAVKKINEAIHEINTALEKR